MTRGERFRKRALGKRDIETTFTLRGFGGLTNMSVFIYGKLILPRMLEKLAGNGLSTTIVRDYIKLLVIERRMRFIMDMVG